MADPNAPEPDQTSSTNSEKSASEFACVVLLAFVLAGVSSGLLAHFSVGHFRYNSVFLNIGTFVAFDIGIAVAVVVGLTFRSKWYMGVAASAVTGVVVVSALDVVFAVITVGRTPDLFSEFMDVMVNGPYYGLVISLLLGAFSIVYIGAAFAQRMSGMSLFVCLVFCIYGYGQYWVTSGIILVSGLKSEGVSMCTSLVSTGFYIGIVHAILLFGALMYIVHKSKSPVLPREDQ